MREIRSYVVRAGRITAAQQRALELSWPRYGVDFDAATLDLSQLTGRQAPRTMEIGFGNGEHLLAHALVAPERDFLGIEVHRAGVGHLLLAAAKAELSNLRIICHDAVEVLQQQIAPAALDDVYLLFPDPWPKTRHHKRRIVQPEFAQLVARALRPGGHWHLATDWEPYAQHMLAVLNDCELLENCAVDGRYAPRPATRAATRFERRGTRLGHQVRDLLYRRR
jgi:tRNA (guanine-N7-)-methyltransferase